MFVAASCRCARTFYGKVDAVCVTVFSLGAVINFVVEFPVIILFVSCARLGRVDLIIRSAGWFLPGWAREVVCLLTVFPLCHLVWATLFVILLHPLHVDLHTNGDSDYDREAFGNVGSAAIHMLPHKWGIFVVMIPKHPWMIICFGPWIWTWVFFFGRAVVSSIRACRTQKSQEHEKALADALWTCELHMSDVSTNAQVFQDGRAGAARS